MLAKEGILSHIEDELMLQSNETKFKVNKDDFEQNALNKQTLTRIKKDIQRSYDNYRIRKKSKNILHTCNVT